ncbi:hypothetical protein AB0383_05000 [Amycolatopsis sp. NPDC051373]|uniref:hypothetical protein n=1 Tax=Amycolatopsis sp. NPDC051373 TaxID=3155801 RepID=UPI00344D4A25
MWDLLHAWREWFAGHDTAQLRVFGIAVLWWGRIGKTLEFVGGLTVVIDLLGRQRMETFHASLRRRRRRLGRWIPRWVRTVLRRPAPEPPPVEQPRPDAHEKGLRVAWFLGTAVLALLLFTVERFGQAPTDDLMPLPILVMFVALIAPTIGGFVLGGGGYVLGLLLVEAFVVTTLGQLKTREGLESRLKWIGLVIFVFGFSLDLLSS